MDHSSVVSIEGECVLLLSLCLSHASNITLFSYPLLFFVLVLTCFSFFLLSLLLLPSILLYSFLFTFLICSHCLFFSSFRISIFLRSEILSSVWEATDESHDVDGRCEFLAVVAMMLRDF